MRYYAYKQINSVIDSLKESTPTAVKTMFYFAISIALLSFSAIIFLICLKIGQSILGL